MAIWDPTEGTLLHKMTAHEKEGRTVSWSPDGRFLTSGGLDRRVRIWDAETSEEKTEGSIALPITVGELEWHPKRALLAAQGHRGQAMVDVYLISMESPGMAPTFVSHDETVSSLAWSLDGKLLATGSGDQSIGLWELDGNSLLPVKRLRGHTGMIASLAWGPEGRRLVSGSSNREVKIWDVPSGELVDDLPGQLAGVESVAWSPASEEILVGDRAGGITFWNPDRVRVDRTLFEAGTPVRALDFSPGGTEIACGIDGQAVRIIDLKTGTSRTVGHNYHTGSRKLSWSEQGEKLAYRVKPFFTRETVLSPVTPGHPMDCGS